MSEPLQIIAIDGSVAPTGALRAIANLARVLAPDVRVTLVLPRTSLVPPEELTAFAEVMQLPIINLRKSVTSLFLYVPSLLWCGWRIASLASRKRARVVITNDFYLMQGIAARLFGYGGSLIAWVRIDPARFPRPIARRWLSLVYRYCHRVVAVSDFIVGRLPPSPKLVRIYDSYEAEGVSVADPAAAGTIVFVGNYIPGKGQDDAIAAFARIAADYPRARLQFFGGDMGLEKNRAYRAGLEASARALGLADRISFGGFAADIGQVYRQGGIALNLSQSESFSFTCLEASAFGLPVIAYRSGGPEEIVVDGETGFLCPLGDVTAVASALSELLGSQGLARSMGERGAARAVSTFGREQFVASVRRLLGAPGPISENRASLVE